jgi:hypothetical protein
MPNARVTEAANLASSEMTFIELPPARRRKSRVDLVVWWRIFVVASWRRRALPAFPVHRLALFVGSHGACWEVMAALLVLVA